MYIVKVDYMGNITWEKNYLFKDDNGKAGNHSGNAVVEVSDGYIVGGSYTIDNGTHSRGAMLTKLSFDGKKIGSKSVTEKEGTISGLINGKEPDHFDAIGFFPSANLLSFENMHAGSPQMTTFTDQPFYSNGIAQNNKHIFVSNNDISPKNGASKLSVYKISRIDKELLSQNTYPTKKAYNRQISFDINTFPNTGALVSTGYVEDHENTPGKTKTYVLKINPDLSPAWEFINDNASKPEQGVGTFSLPNGGAGVIVNVRDPISDPCHTCSGKIDDRIYTSINSNIVLYRLDKNGKLQ